MSPGLILTSFYLHLRLGQHPKDWDQARRIYPISRYSPVRVPNKRRKKATAVLRRRGA